MAFQVSHCDIVQGASPHWNVVRVSGRILATWLQFLRRTRAPTVEWAVGDSGVDGALSLRTYLSSRHVGTELCSFPLLKPAAALPPLRIHFIFSVHLSFGPFVHPSIHQSIHPSFHLPIVHPSIRPCVHPFIHLSIHVPIRPSILPFNTVTQCLLCDRHHAHLGTQKGTEPDSCSGESSRPWEMCLGPGKLGQWTVRLCGPSLYFCASLETCKQCENVPSTFVIQDGVPLA